mgnify:FL=1
MINRLRTMFPAAYFNTVLLKDEKDVVYGKLETIIVSNVDFFIRVDAYNDKTYTTTVYFGDKVLHKRGDTPLKTVLDFIS